MNKENESIAVVTAPVYDLMFHYLAQARQLLCLAKEEISLSEQLCSRWLRDMSKDLDPELFRSLSGSKKALKVSLSEIDKLIKRVDGDCEDFLDNCSLDDDNSVIFGD